MPEYSQIAELNSRQISNTNTPTSSTSPFKFFAPVQIIAPTVYLHSNTSNANNNIVFKLDDAKGKAQNPEVKAYQDIKMQRMPKGGNGQQLRTQQGRNAEAAMG